VNRHRVTQRPLTIVATLVLLVGSNTGAHFSLTVAQAADDTPIPASAALAAGCNETDLSDAQDTARNDPIWTPIIHDANHPVPFDPPTILEGTVATPDQKFGPNNETSTSQAPSEVAEEDLPWNHYTHDKTLNVIPDPGYKHLLSSYVNADGTTAVHEDMEVEWDSASLMEDNRTWGAEPDFVWPSVRDRVWVEGRWIFDCGHPGGTTADTVQYETEIHPPRAVVAFRLNHSVNAGSWLPVTGGETKIPVTEADAFVSGNGGGANDRCSLIDRHISAVDGVLSLGFLGIDDCDHTGPVIPINDRNYVFDIYPPGTNFDPSAKLPNGTWPVTVPTRDGSGTDVSLQWKTVDQSSEIPAHACGEDPTVCFQVTPLYCLADATTPAPDQTETACPPVPAHPTRLRVILPFAGASPDAVFAQSILLGWDDVPAALDNHIRTFRVRLHQLTVDHNGESGIHDGDWRVFADVGGQWRYMSPLFDTNSSGDNVCDGDALTENGDGNCFRFDQAKWTVEVQDGTPIHVALGGWESDTTDSDFCRTYLGCDPGVNNAFNLFAFNDDRIGTSEFDLSTPSYGAPPVYQTTRIPDGEQYTAEWTVAEVPAFVPPTTGAVSVGSPHFTSGAGTTFVTPSTPLTLSTVSTEFLGFQYRFHKLGAPLPTFPSWEAFPVHWTSTDYQQGPRSAQLSLGSSGVGDGQYNLQYSAQTNVGLTEPRHTFPFSVDTTPPTIAITQPAATQYTHSATLTLDYSVSDGSGSGVQSVSPLMDGAATLAGHGLQSGQAIKLLTELPLGPHTFSVSATDNLGNASSKSVTFTIIVTADSIKDDVTQLVAGGLINGNKATSLLAKLNAAANDRAKGKCSTAANSYGAFINEVQAQTGKGIDPQAAAILIADAQYLIAHCP
jgi:hypothetical protein